MLKPDLIHIGMDHQNVASIQLGDMDIDPLIRVNTFHPSLFEDWLQSCRRFGGLAKIILSKGSNPDTFLALGGCSISNDWQKSAGRNQGKSYMVGDDWRQHRFRGLPLKKEGLPSTMKAGLLVETIHALPPEGRLPRSSHDHPIKGSPTGMGIHEEQISACWKLPLQMG